MTAHIGDEELLLANDGELEGERARLVRVHLAECAKCRDRVAELERGVIDFIEMHRESAAAGVPADQGARRLLKARLAAAHVSEAHSGRPAGWMTGRKAMYLAAGVAIVMFGLFLREQGSASSERAISVPDARLTPGAALASDSRQVCSARAPKNREVPVDLQRRVLAAYGVRSAEPHAYEVDYLITPALGGAEDIHNLWPQSESSTIWNSRVKDELEDRLRDMVCTGQLDLPTAQREIATDWIGAYKRYFRTDRPIPEPEPAVKN